MKEGYAHSVKPLGAVVLSMSLSTSATANASLEYFTLIPTRGPGEPPLESESIREHGFRRTPSTSVCDIASLRTTLSIQPIPPSTEGLVLREMKTACPSILPRTAGEDQGSNSPEQAQLEITSGLFHEPWVAW